jgi:futalosine hydrolase
MAGLLVVTAVEAERASIESALPERAGVQVVAGGAGPAAAAAATAGVLAADPDRPDLVLSAGIAGGFAPLGPGDLAVSSAIVFADLGAQTSQGFVPANELGFAAVRYDVGPQLAVELADTVGGRLGTVLTVATATGTAARAGALLDRYPDAVAEAMEGAGVAAAAARCGVRVAELRAISNPVGPRDREAWAIPRALEALGRAVSALASRPAGWAR